MFGNTFAINLPHTYTLQEEYEMEIGLYSLREVIAEDPIRIGVKLAIQYSNKQEQNVKNNKRT